MLVGALVLQGCASKQGAPATPAAGSTLAAERQWLQSWFEGTPVVIAQRDDDVLTIDVPREFSFDKGYSTVKPPLAKVLDKVADSLRRTPQIRLQVAAPDDTGAATALARQRAAQVRHQLLVRSVPAARMGRPTVTTAPAVQVRMEFTPSR
jgi:outer membrane protein OmpA-like peptidoglycan-associated protein